MRRYRERAGRRYADLSPAERTKYRARAAAQKALHTGRLSRSSCTRCGGPGEQMHHADYSRQLDIEWLCTPCHKAHHAADREAGR